MRRVVVVGGGIAGLATAYFLRERARVTVLESGPRAGGKLLTERHRGFLLEGGPDAFVAYKPAAVALCRELGLELAPTLPARHRSRVLHRGRLRPLPEGLVGVIPSRWLPMALTPLLSLGAKLRMLADLWLPASEQAEDESLGAFLARRLGTELVDRLADPLLGGIYGAPAHELSARCLFPRLLALEKQYRSLIRGVLSQPSAPRGPEMLSLRDGMQALPEALARHLDVRLGWAAQRVESGRVIVDGQALEADAVVLATPAPVSARLLGRAGGTLARVAYQRVATVGLAFRRDQVAHPLDGHGFVIPKSESVTACTWASSKFADRAPEGAVLLRAYLRGPSGQDEALAASVAEQLRPLLGLRGEPVLSRVHRWENPVYRVGHGELVDEAERALPAGIHLTGSAYRGVGVPDCIEQARLTAERIARG